MNSPIFPRPLLDALRNARHVAVLTGAGISAESGVPTFRDAQTGLWARFRPEELATAAAFERDPSMVWKWYAWRRELVSGARPNSAHHALVTMAAAVPTFTLVTQNVDGLHAAAGSRDVIELHGNIHRNKCFDEGRVVEVPAGSTEAPPRCPHCGAWVRPDVVWFGESLPPDALARADAAARNADVFFSIGTSALVHPAAELPAIARRAGATVVEVNRDPTPLTAMVTYALQGPAGVLLPALVAAAWPAA